MTSIHTTSDTQQLRFGIKEACNALDQTGMQPDRPPAFTYVPPSHVRALDPEVTLVEGIRGAGKSFWWAQLSSPAHREFVKAAYPEVRFESNIRVSRGFGTKLSNADGPSAAALIDLLEEFRPRSIWRAVLAHHLGFKGAFAALTKWKDRTAWVQSHAEEYDEQLESVDLQLESNGVTHLILFDALDRMSDDWSRINQLARALLQVALDVRSTRRIRFKVFVRPDIIQDRSIMGFPDASKLLARKAELKWRRSDIYALLFQCLANWEHGGATFRTLTATVAGLTWIENHGYWIIPAQLRSDETLQELIFHKMTGGAMGASTKRGKPYTWLVNHLQDGFNQVSPRSFFAALETAAVETPEQNKLALDYRAIQIGVQKASQIRVSEITEDYAWVDLAMAPLYGNVTVPCDENDFKKIWDKNSTIQNLSEGLKMGLKEGQDLVKLPPQNLDDGAKGLLRDLEALGIVQRLTDQRIQMPDVYRIAFGLGRRGGVKPLK